MPTITLVRHGNTDFNIQKRAQGHLNNPLNETGRKQALALAKRLAEENWDILISSDLLRARETAEIISDTMGMPIDQLDSRIREICRGQIAGTIEEERIAKWGENWRELDLGEETLPALRARGVEFIDDIVKQYPNKKVLVVTHGLLLGQTLKGLLQDETIGESLVNTSVTTVKKTGSTWHCTLYNCARHLNV